MKKAFEKFRKAKQYMAEKNTAELTKMVRDIIETESGFHFTFEFEKTECFESVTNYMIVSELINAQLYGSDFIPDEELTKLCTHANNLLDAPSSIWGNPSPLFDHYLMSLIHPEKRLNVIRIIMNKIDQSFPTFCNKTRYLALIVWYAAFEDDDTILDELCRMMEDCNLSVDNIVPDKWFLMYIEVIIQKNRYDLLDKIIPLIFESVDYDFTHFHSYIKMDMSYSELVYLLCKRYRPEMNDGQIVEQLINSYHFTNLIHNSDDTDKIKAELNFITNLNFKTNAVNCVLALWAMSDSELPKEYLYGLLSDKPVLYLGDSWFDFYAMRYNINPGNYAFMLNLLKDNPQITLSIDNNDTLSVFLGINNTQLNQIFSIRKPVITDKITDNKLMCDLIRSNAKQLKPLFKHLELDEEARTDLIELCVEYKNLSALNLLNKQVKKE